MKSLSRYFVYGILLGLFILPQYLFAATVVHWDTNLAYPTGELQNLSTTSGTDWVQAEIPFSLENRLSPQGANPPFAE